MAVDMFLKLDGIKGEARDAKHKGEIDVLAWSWGGTQTANWHMGGGGGAGKVTVQNLSLTKYIDLASADLLLCLCNGKHISKGTLVVRKAGGDPLDYLKVTMEDIIVTSVSTGGSGGNDRLTENVSLSFARVRYRYTEQLPTGGAGGQPEMGWDIAGNRKY
jgi:type VI secretion system secreted protein Hcp